MEKFTRKLGDRMIMQLRVDEQFHFLHQKALQGKVFPAVRKNTVDFYFKGRRLYHKTANHYKTDAKYLRRAAENAAPPTVVLQPYNAGAYQEEYEVIKANIELLKKKEREAVNTICTKYSYLNGGDVVVLDVEVGFPGMGATVDLLLFNTTTLELKLVEGKLFGSKQFMSTQGKAEVFSQIDRYQRYLVKEAQSLIEAYGNYIDAVNQLFHLTLPTPRSLSLEVNLLIVGVDAIKEKSKSYREYFLHNPAHKGYKYYALDQPENADIKDLYKGHVL